MIEWLANGLWSPWLLGGFLLLGLYLSLVTGFFQLFEFKLWLRTTVGSLGKSRRAKRNGVTQFQAMATALASTVGTGSIAGVSTAIIFGGPGAVFWLWVSAILGMMTGCVEKILSVHYRERNPQGGWYGGPMYYIEYGLKSKALGMWFAFACVLASLGGGNLVQANSIATSLTYTFGWDPLIIGIIVAGLCGLVMLGGIGRIGKVCETLVPVMAILFLLSGWYVIIIHIDMLPLILVKILGAAFTPVAVAGGGFGYGVGVAMRYGVARGVFTNEAGIGSSAIAHASADVSSAAEQGMWGIFEVFFATLVVCSTTALVILLSGVYDATLGAETYIELELIGAPLTAAGFGTVLGSLGSVVVTISLLLFAFSSILGWSYYGEQSLQYLCKKKNCVPYYRIIFLICVVVGSAVDVGFVWQMADIFNGLMAIPNLVAILILSPLAIKLLWKWKKHGT